MLLSISHNICTWLCFVVLWLYHRFLCSRADSRFAPSQWETALLCNDVSHWLGASLASGRADSRFAPSQWETALLCNDVSHWLGASLESALLMYDIHLSMLFPTASLGLEQSYDCLDTSWVIIKDNGWNLPLFVHNKTWESVKHMHIYWNVLLVAALIKKRNQGLYSLRRYHLIGIGILIINLRRSSDHLRSLMEIPIPIRQCLFSE